MDRSASGRAIFGLVGTLVLLVVELVLTMVVYSWLNLYSLETFGALVRFARSVLDVMTRLVERWIPGSANTVYATLFGELGPKAILLLLIGLVVAAIVRSISGLVASARHG